MAKDILCYVCKKPQPIEFKMPHDENTNLLCFHCKSVIFPVSIEEEGILKTKIASSCGMIYKSREILPIKSSGCSDNNSCFVAEEEFASLV